MSERQMVLKHRHSDCTIRIDLPADMKTVGEVCMALGPLDFYLPIPEGKKKLLLEIDLVPGE